MQLKFNTISKGYFALQNNGRGRHGPPDSLPPLYCKPCPKRFEALQYSFSLIQTEVLIYELCLQSGQNRREETMNKSFLRNLSSVTLLKMNSFIGFYEDSDQISRTLF